MEGGTAAAAAAGGSSSSLSLFSSAPRSFRMDRRSPPTSRLKASVSRKLVEFLGSYTDDVLAEYIVVLVCNGKHQNQARDELEAFLGDDSEKFVTWLWQHLSEEFNLSKTPVESPGLKADVTAAHDGNGNMDHMTDKSMELQIQSDAISITPLFQGGNSTTTKSSHNKKDTDGSSRRSHDGDNAHVAMVKTEDLGAQTCRIDRISGASPEIHSEATNYTPPRVVCSSEISAGGEQFLQFEGSYIKIGRSKSSEPLHQPLLSPKREPVSRNLKSVIAEDPLSRPQSITETAGGRLPPRDKDFISHQSSRPRGSVWDRLGKPREDADVLMNEKVYQQCADIKRKKNGHTGEGLDKDILMSSVLGARIGKRSFGETAVLDNSYGKPILNNQAAEYRTAEHSVDTMKMCGDAIDQRWKRQFGEKAPGNGSVALSDHRDKYPQDEEPYQKLQKSLSANSIHKRNNQVTAENSILPGAQLMSASHSLKSEKILHGSRSDEICSPQFKRKISISTSMQAPVPVISSIQSKSESFSNAEHANANYKPVQDEVLNVKLKLRQIEREMLELRSKQAEISSDAKSNVSLGSGVRSHSEEDAGSRTVFVTNVHFAATKEALSSHFAQCGLVLRVVLLTDTITGQPKGSAYIVFANKESVDRAISLSGTSFFSRTLQVMRKTDMPTATLASNQAAAGKPPLPPKPWYHPQPCWRKSAERQFPSSHLQWRRDQSGHGEDSMPSTATRESVGGDPRTTME